MEEKKKRDGSVGDVWSGMFGDKSKEKVPLLIQQTLQSLKAVPEKFGDCATVVDSSFGLPTQVLLKIIDGKMHFQSIIIRFPQEFENICFEPDSMDEWANEGEGTLEGSIFGGHNFSFYCQNYLSYKGQNLVGKKMNVNVTVIARNVAVLPEKERSFVPDGGPLKGETVFIDKMRYLNPVHDGDPEMCQFFFPILQIEMIKFYGEDIYKIKGVLSDSDSEKDYFYNVFFNKSLIADPASLKVGEPLKGWGWIQAEVVGLSQA